MKETKSTSYIDHHQGGEETDEARILLRDNDKVTRKLQLVIEELGGEISQLGYDLKDAEDELQDAKYARPSKHDDGWSYPENLREAFNKHALVEADVKKKTKIKAFYEKTLEELK